MAFWKANIARAFLDSFHAYGGKNIVIWVLVFAVTYCLARFRGDGEQKKHVSNTVWSLAATIIVFCAVFFWHLLYATPNDIFTEQRDKIASLEHATNRLQLQINLKPTPVRDDAMRLAEDFDQFYKKCASNKLSTAESHNRFVMRNYDRWLLRVHDNLAEHNRRSDYFDDVANMISTFGVMGVFSQLHDSPTNVVCKVRDEVRRLADGLDK